MLARLRTSWGNNNAEPWDADGHWRVIPSRADGEGPHGYLPTHPGHNKRHVNADVGYPDVAGRLILQS